MWQWFLAGALVLLNVATILIVVVVVRVQFRRGGLDRGPAAPPAGTLGQDVADLIAQLDRLAADLDARLADRSRRLQTLLAEADKRIARLDLLPGSSSPAGGDGAAETRRQEICRLARQEVDSVEIARRLGMDVGEVELVLSLARSAAGRET